MPAREDFAVIRSRAFSDPRIQTCGSLLTQAGLACEDTAIHTVRGFIAAYGFFLIRDGNTGVLAGDGILATRSALGLGTKDAIATVEAFKTSGLLRPKEEGLYLSGFNDAYKQLIKKRDYNLGRKNEQGCHNLVTTKGQGCEPTVAVAVAVAGSESKTTTTAESVATPPTVSQSETPPVNGSPERFMDSSPLLKPGVAQTFDLRGVAFRELPGSLNAWAREVNALHSAGVSADDLAGWLLDPANRVRAPWDLRERFRPSRGKKDGNGFVMSDAEARAAVKRLRAEGKIK